MLTVAQLLDALEGLAPDAQVVVGIINGPRYSAAYANRQVCGTAVALSPDHHELRGEAPALYVCCYEQPRPWEGVQPTLSEDGTAMLEYDPEEDPDRPRTDPNAR
jgi:hypothetical protein